MKHPFLSVLLLGIASMGFNADAQVAPEAGAWGAVADGLQLQLSTGVNTENLTETQSQLYLTATMRNTAEKPAFAAMEHGQATYDFEYEIDGAWYAFEPMTPVPTPLTAMRQNSWYLESVQTMAPGSSKGTMLILPLAARWPSLQLHAITPAGLGKPFEPKPGPHVVRVRPGRAVIADRPAPVSNAVSISFRTPASIDTRGQSVTFAPARDALLREFRFAAGPADAQTLIRAVLARPPYAPEPLLVTSAALQVIDPLPYYEHQLPRRMNVVSATLPASAMRYHYLLLAGGEVAGSIGVEPAAAGLVFNSLLGSTLIHSEPVFRALQQLAGMEQVRGGGYEPRLLKVIGVRGASLQLVVVWLHSASRPDLFYLPQYPDIRGWTKVESGKVYNLDEFTKAARALPAAPEHDEAWAVATSLACAKAKPEIYRDQLLVDRAEVEIAMNEKQDGIEWYVFIPSPMPPRVMMNPEPGAAFLVNDADGSCKPVGGRH